MTAIETMKDALEYVVCLDVNPKTTKLTGQNRIVLAANMARKALKTYAELEAEKPAEDAIDVVERIYELYGDNCTKESIEVLQQYAEAYHAKRCAECKK